MALEVWRECLRTGLVVLVEEVVRVDGGVVMGMKGYCLGVVLGAVVVDGGSRRRTERM